MTSAAGNGADARAADDQTAGDAAHTRPEWTGRHRTETPPAAMDIGPAPHTPETGDPAAADGEAARAQVDAHRSADEAAGLDGLGRAGAQTAETSGHAGATNDTIHTQAPVAEAAGIDGASEAERADALTGGEWAAQNPEMGSAQGESPEGGQAEAPGQDADGAGRQASIRKRWAVIADLHAAGVAIDDIADRVGITPGAVDLILQAHRRNRVTLRD